MMKDEKTKYYFMVCIYVVIIAITFITIGLVFPNDFTLFGIPGLGVIHYMVIQYLFAAVGFLYKKKT